MATRRREVASKACARTCPCRAGGRQRNEIEVHQYSHFCNILDELLFLRFWNHLPGGVCVLFFWFLVGWLVGFEVGWLRVFFSGFEFFGWFFWLSFCFGFFLFGWVFCFFFFNFHQKTPLTVIKTQLKPFSHFLSFCGWCSLNHAEFSFLLGKGSI